MARNLGGFDAAVAWQSQQPVCSRSSSSSSPKIHPKPNSVRNTTPSAPQTIDIRSASKPFSHYSIHTPDLQFLQQRRFLSSLSESESDSDSKNLLSGPSNLFVVESLSMHYEALEKVKICLRFSTTLHPGAGLNGPKSPLDIFGISCKRKAPESSLDKLEIHKTPTFHCYLKGETVDELASASARHLKRRLENVYNQRM